MLNEAPASESPALAVEESDYERRRLPLKEVAKRVRADLKEKQKAGELPKSKWAVSMSPGGHALHVGLKAVDMMCVNPEWVLMHKEEGQNVSYEDRRRSSMHSPACNAMFDAVEALVQRYNYNNSDVQSDYFDVNFYGGHPELERDLEKAQEAKVLEVAAMMPKLDDRDARYFRRHALSYAADFMELEEMALRFHGVEDPGEVVFIARHLVAPKGGEF